MGAVLEAFPTLGTLVQAFHNVDLPMSAKWEFVDSLPTDSALIRLLPSVSPLVNYEAIALVEAFPTFPTLVSSLPCVSPQVGSGLGVFTEAFPIFTVLVMLLSCVNSDAEQGKKLGQSFSHIHDIYKLFPVQWLAGDERRENYESILFHTRDVSRASHSKISGDSFSPGMELSPHSPWSMFVLLSCHWFCS